MAGAGPLDDGANANDVLWTRRQHIEEGLAPLKSRYEWMKAQEQERDVRQARRRQDAGDDEESDNDDDDGAGAVDPEPEPYTTVALPDIGPLDGVTAAAGPFQLLTPIQHTLMALHRADSDMAHVLETVDRGGRIGVSTLHGWNESLGGPPLAVIIHPTQKHTILIHRLVPGFVVTLPLRPPCPYFPVVQAFQ